MSNKIISERYILDTFEKDIYDNKQKRYCNITKSEYQLLNILYDIGDRYATVEELHQLMYNEKIVNKQVNNNIVVFIKRINDKIIDLIENKKCFGYRLIRVKHSLLIHYDFKWKLQQVIRIIKLK